jgi:hypothetical protein
LEDRLARSNRPFAILSAYELALWLATNWWRLRWEPEREGTDWRLAHSMTAIGGGYVWPEITFSSDGEQLQVQGRPTRGEEWEPIRYLESWTLGVAAKAVEEAIDSFVQEVLARLAGCQISGTDLHVLWQDLRAERFDAEIASLRKLEALLGFDASTAADDLIDRLQSVGSTNGQAAIEEVAAGYGPGSTSVIDQVTEGLESARLISCDFVRELATRQTDWNFLAPPWERASAAAHAAREIYNLNGEPASNSVLAQMAGAELIEAPAAGVPMSAARWTGPDRRTWSLLLRSRWPAGRRFELCRLIGDGLIAPEGDLLLPATAAKTSRQKFQRAFAQEFLCPFASLMARIGSAAPDDEAIEEAAAHFQVSPLLVRTTLVNKNILPRDQLVDVTQG